GCFVFVPPEMTERLIGQAGFVLVRREDVTSSIESTAGRWLAARHQRREALLGIEGEERFEGHQRFLAATHALASERRLSRFAFVVEKPALTS
ncbi:MAG: SAM-dependent methyltransferase, partial [Burkholderiaceae bacterium]